MRRAFVVAQVVVACAVAGGCGGGGKQYTQAQLNAIETRDVEANLEATFNAATGALFDSGYTVAMSDRNAGLLTGTKGKDRTMDRIFWSPYIADDRFTVSISMRAIDNGRTAVRVKTSVNGEPKVNKKAIDQIWTLMQRQVLMKEPLAAGQQLGTASAGVAGWTGGHTAVAPSAPTPAARPVTVIQGTTDAPASSPNAATRLPPRRSATTQ